MGYRSGTSSVVTAKNLVVEGIAQTYAGQPAGLNVTTHSVGPYSGQGASVSVDESGIYADQGRDYLVYPYILVNGQRYLGAAVQAYAENYSSQNFYVEVHLAAANAAGFWVYSSDDDAYATASPGWLVDGQGFSPFFEWDSFTDISNISTAASLGYQIYAYKIINGTRVHSPTSASFAGAEPAAGFSYVCQLTWTKPADAAGCLVVKTVGTATFYRDVGGATSLVDSGDAWEEGSPPLVTSVYTNIVGINAGATNITGNVQISGEMLNDLLLASGKAVKNTHGELAMRMSGDSLGGINMLLRNRTGLNGAMFEQVGTEDLVDFAFKTLTKQMNLRVEGRSMYSLSGYAPEIQIGEVSGMSFYAGLVLNKDRVFLRAPTTGPSSGLSSAVTFWLDQTNNKLKVSVRYSNGIAKTGEIALV